MGINNFNFKNLNLKLSNDGYLDFYLANDAMPPEPCSGLTSGSSLVVWYDFNNPSIYPNSATSATSIYSLVTWNEAINTGYTFNTIGLTGIDNGLITFVTESGDTSNQVLLSAITGSTLVILSGNTGLVMNRVTGMTGNYIYPMNYITTTASTGNYTNFCGGFYQGYYQLDGTNYEVLPNRVSQAWGAEFWLNPSTSNCSGYTGTTLNHLYPNNTGIFFYMGTRAENKYWNQFFGNDTGCTVNCYVEPGSGCTASTVSSWCTIPKETDITFVGDYGLAIPLAPPQVEIEIVTNNFLIYGRGSSVGPTTYTADTGSVFYSTGTTQTGSTYYNNCYGCQGPMDGLGNQRLRNYNGGGIIITRTPQELTNFNNPFLIYGRGSGYVNTASTGTTTGSTSGNTNNGYCNGCQGPMDGFGNQRLRSFSGMTSPITKLDYNVDTVDNALGFIIRNDGSIGYRLLTVTGNCYTISGETLNESGVTIQEAYSVSGMVASNAWSYIAIRFVTNYYTDCELSTNPPRTGKLLFYVNAKLKFVVDEFPELVAKRLSEYKAKQLTVPFNFSLGGGSQGLLENMTLDGPDPSDIGLPIETNFAGTFIGGISQFKFNITDLSFCNIQHNYNMDAARYGITTLNYGSC